MGRGKAVSAEERKEVWMDLCDHHNSPIIGTKTWMILGDFNETLDMNEHSNFDSSPAVSMGMRGFQDMVNHCSLTDMAYHGPLFTWSNKRGDDLISKKLDWVTMYGIRSTHRLTPFSKLVVVRIT